MQRAGVLHAQATEVAEGSKLNMKNRQGRRGLALHHCLEAGNGLRGQLLGGVRQSRAEMSRAVWGGGRAKGGCE